MPASDLGNLVENVLVFVGGGDESALLQCPQVPLDLALLLLQGQLSILHQWLALPLVTCGPGGRGCTARHICSVVLLLQGDS